MIMMIFIIRGLLLPIKIFRAGASNYMQNRIWLRWLGFKDQKQFKKSLS